MGAGHGTMHIVIENCQVEVHGFAGSCRRERVAPASGGRLIALGGDAADGHQTLVSS
jgi:hypothetical protein